ncbi:serine aminopeptidase domain-containing protein [Mycobacterium camsae]|uniref:serine aminopeptidase domain-containing protein n=1 Tax=Mycobacterium gordonae TaxID=1778 RepID=UPI001980F707|nr:alpha/beta hydrolase [Mycobacterium gordonae]
MGRDHRDRALAVAWTEQPATRHRMRTTVVTVGDGGRFRITRLGEGCGIPAVLLPGMFDNRRLYLWPGGLAEALADAGFDPWIVERRGTGDVAQAFGTRAGWEEMVRVDLPAVQRLIADDTGRPAFWLGHSFGGVALARAAAETLDRSGLAGLVLVNSAVDIPLLANRVVNAAVRSRIWKGVFPSRRLRLGPEDEPIAALDDAVGWGIAERCRGDLSSMLTTVDVPLLAITAPRDGVAPASRTRRMVRPAAGLDRRVQSAGRAHGFARDYAHANTLLHPVARTDVFPFLVDWLVARSGQLAPAKVTAPQCAGRHRLRFRATLDVPVEQLFRILIRHWAVLWPVRQRRVRDGVDAAEPDGLRSVRAQRVLGIWRIQEEIVTYQPPRLIEYRTIKGPVRNHLGRIELRCAPGGGTVVDYRVGFDTPGWLPGRIVARVLDGTWRRWSLPRLRRLATTMR